MSCTVTVECNPAGSGASQRSALINGGCQVAQRDAATLSGTFQFGEVDRWACRADGTPTNGSITQSKTAPIGRTGFSLHVADVTTGSGGTVQARYRMESADARAFKNQTAVFSALVQHDVGSAIDYTITLNRATAEDDFSSVTQVATTMVNVPDATGTAISLSADMGDSSNGIEIIVEATPGAVTTKNFHFTEMQFEFGSTATSFDYRKVAEVFEECLRYAYVIRPGAFPGRVSLGQAGLTTVAQMRLDFPSAMRVGPAFSISALADFQLGDAFSVGLPVTNIAALVAYNTGISFNVTVASGLVAGDAVQWIAQNATASMTLDAEL